VEQKGLGCGWLFVALALACSKKTVKPLPVTDAAQVDYVPPAEELDAMWRAAEALETGDLVRLASREGVSGLIEGAAAVPKRLRVAVVALGYTHERRALPFLVTTMKDEKDNARDAAESVHMIAARGLRSYDPEDAEEFREGCDGLLAYARDKGNDRAIRVVAVNALRMFATQGCPKAEEIPTDVDP
jgi:hypothetical protein